MDIKTHLLANKQLLGTPIEVVEGISATVKLEAIDNMIVDDRGLVHGGFTFSLADYSAMLAVNHPNVVIGSANIRFTSPVKCGDIMIAKAVIVDEIKNKRLVNVEVYVDNETVFKGDLTCYVLEKHVLDS